MNINKENYEIWFLDYYGKNLQPAEVAELMIFLEENPDLKAEFESFDSLNIEPDHKIQIAFKESLKKRDYQPTENIDPWNYEEMMVAALEGDITEEESAALKEFLRINPDAVLEMDLFRKTYLKPENVEFPDKNSLKKDARVIAFRNRTLEIAALAASVVILFGIYWIFNSTRTTDNTRMAFDVNLNPVPPKSFSDHIPEKIAVLKDKGFTPVPDHPENPEIAVVEKINTVKPIEFGKPDFEFDLNDDVDEQPSFVLNKNKYSGLPVTNYLNQASEHNRSFAARFIAGLVEKLIGHLEIKQKSLIEYTVEGYNIIADREVEVEKKFDQKGDVVAYNVVGGDHLIFSHQVKKPSSE